MCDLLYFQFYMRCLSVVVPGDSNRSMGLSILVTQVINELTRFELLQLDLPEKKRSRPQLDVFFSCKRAAKLLRSFRRSSCS